MESKNFNLEDFRWPGTDAQESLNRHPPRAPRHRLGERFLKGPIPWNWLETAAHLPGKALPLSLVIWRESGYRKTATIKLCLNRIGMSISEQAARRALRVLETAGLISIERKPGRGLEVTLREPRK